MFGFVYRIGSPGRAAQPVSCQVGSDAKKNLIQIQIKKNRMWFRLGKISDPDPFKKIYIYNIKII